MAVHPQLLSSTLALIKSTGRASAGHVQRHLRCTLAEAFEVMDELQRLGVVGPERQIEPRDILVDLSTYRLPEGGNVRHEPRDP